ncbi:MAG: hypothetical protein KC994_06600 [Candidatus Omnitrophica bacterium]|nr:hypothetical protein [Candidatus Omnitrophota bacterium]
MTAFIWSPKSKDSPIQSAALKLIPRILFIWVWIWLNSGPSICQVNPYRDLLPAAENQVRPTYVLDRSEALQDLLVLERVIKQGYSGYDVLGAEGMDWESFFQGLARDVATREDWRQSEFLDLLRGYLQRIPDLHFGVFDRGQWLPARQPERVFLTGIRVRKEGAAPLIVVEAPRGHSETVGSELVTIDGETSSDFLFETLPGKSGARDYYLGKWSTESEPAPVGIEVKTPEGKSVQWKQELHSPGVRLKSSSGRPFRLTYIPFPRIEIRTFSALVGLDLDQFRESAERAKDFDSVVVDLRGNQGGSDRYAREWLETLFGAPAKGWNISELVSPVTLQGNVLLHQWLLSHARNGAEKKEIGGRLAYAIEQLDQAEKESIERHWEKFSGESMSDPQTNQPFNGKLVLLVDSNTSSSAETFVLMARQFPQTVVLGENTHGMARFGEIKLYRLPNSGFWIQAGSKHFEDPSGRFEEGRGFLPDYWLETSDPISGILERLDTAIPED